MTDATPMEDPVPNSEPVTVPVVPTGPKTVRSTAQLEVLARARARAIEVRREAAAIRHKEKAIKAAEKHSEKQRIETEYSKMVEPPIPEEEEEDPAPPPPKKKKRVVVVREESASEDEEIEVRLPRARPPPPEPLPNPFDRPFIPFFRG